ncbi:MAG: response regulator [Chloroflexota bacterium]
MSPLALIIEDDSSLSEIFQVAVEASGYETKTFVDGAMALVALQSETPDLVVLDIHLPKVSGLTILKSIRNQKRLDKSWVLAVTADSAAASSLRDETGADFVLDKPVSFHQLKDLATRLHPDNAPGGRK